MGVCVVLLGFCVYVCIHFVSWLCVVCAVFAGVVVWGSCRMFVEVAVFCLAGFV